MLALHDIVGHTELDTQTTIAVTLQKGIHINRIRLSSDSEFHRRRAHQRMNFRQNPNIWQGFCRKLPENE